jgi:hypothetical protein
MAEYTYATALDDIVQAVNTLEKVAEEQKHVTDADVLEGDPRKLHGPGKKKDMGALTEEALAGTPDPNQEDDGTKSIKHLLDKEKVADKTVKASANIGAALLQQIHSRLYGKKASEEAEEEKKKEEEEAEEDAEVEYTEEELDAMEEMDETKKAAFRMSKQAGANFASQLHKSGLLEKIAMAMYAPHLDKLVSFQVGQTLQELEKQGMFTNRDGIIKAASFIAGSQIAEAEKAQAGSRQAEITKAASFIAGAQIANMEKQGSLVIQDAQLAKQANQAPSRADNRELLKSAAEQSTVRVINELHSKTMGRDLNSKLENLLVNP